MQTDPKNLIVCYRDRQTAGQRTLGILLHIVFWCIMLYLIVTFIALCCQMIDDTLFTNLIDKKDSLAIKHLITRFFPWIGGFICVFLLWALYNKLRFKGERDRRQTQPPPITLEETAQTTRLGKEDILRMHQSKILTCMFDDNGNIVSVLCDTANEAIREKQPANAAIIHEKISA